MVRVDENRLKGNYGAALVTQILSQRCLVRPVAEGTDIGVDLYCESVTKDGKPFQHFWVQVRTGLQIQVTANAEFATARFDRRHLEYWDRQPVPVFGLVFPLPAWPPEPPKDIYVIDITEHLLRRGVPQEDQINLQSLSIPNTLQPGNVERLEWFLYQHVPTLTGARKIRDGIIDCTESPEGNRYVKRLVSGWTPRFVRNVLDTMRRTAAFGALDLMDTGQPQDPEQSRWWELLLTILKVFDNFGQHHYEHDLAYGRAAYLRGDLVEARKIRDGALRGIEGDVKLNESEKQLFRDVVERYLSEEMLKESQP